MHYVNQCECGGQTHVLDSRQKSDGSIQRRRECLSCGKRFNTTEVESDVLKDKVKKIDIIYPSAIMMKAADGKKIIYDKRGK